MANEKRARQKQGRAVRRHAYEESQRKQKMRRTFLWLSLAMATFLLILWFQGKKTDNNASSTTTTSVVVGSNECPKNDGSSPHTIEFPPGVAKACLTPGAKYKATVTTTEGTFVVDLDRNLSENGVNGFVFLSRYHYYDDTKIFRTDTSIDIFQGGSPHTQDNTDTGPSSQGTWYIPDESKKYTYEEGDFIFARSSQANSTSAQFFVGAGPKVSVLNDQGNYIKIGRITSGLDVAKKILALNQDDPSSQLGGAPSREVKITKIEITETS